jgi:secreted Zn-dependent insulinase-like peptidase
VKLNIIESILGSLAFNYLRAELQLGYAAKAQITKFDNVLGISILVVGTKKYPYLMNEDIENSLKMGLE